MPHSLNPAPPPIANTPMLWRHAIPQRSDADHKYSRGHCIVWSGPELATGASRLAARAALRIGAGLVSLAGTRSALLVHAAHETSIMLRDVDTRSDWARLLEDRRIRGLVIGPAAGLGTGLGAGFGAGLGRTTRQAVLTALRANIPIVLDADALTVFAGQFEALVAAIRRHPRPVILTPHEGEFAALFGEQADVPRESRAHAAAIASGAIVVLKGHRTLIAAPDGRLSVNTNAPATLATAGSGDVLAGIAAGLLTQGMPGFEAACCAAWLHGEIGRIAGAHPIADDLVEAIRHLPPLEALE